MKIDNPIDVATAAANDYRQSYGSELVSVIVYGSAAGGDFDAARSDVNLLIVLSNVTLPALEKSASVQEKWLKRRFAPPLFMDRAYIKQSLDSFPIEFLDMKGCYKVVAGDDVLADIHIEMSHLRLQIERELKGKRLHLMQQWLRARKSSRDLKGLLTISLHDFAPIFRALLHISNKSIPHDRASLYSSIDAGYALEDKPFQHTFEALQSGDSSRIAAVFPIYTLAVKKLAEIIDSL